MPTRTDYKNQVPRQGGPGSDIKARNTGSSKAILADGKENYFLTNGYVTQEALSFLLIYGKNHSVSMLGLGP